MSTEAISQPSVSHRGRRKSVLVVLVTVAAVGVAGALVVTRSSGETSGGHAIADPPPVVSASRSLECGVDVEYLAAEVGTMPANVRAGVIAGLSPHMHLLVDRAIVNQASIGTGALQYGFPYSPPVPDGPTLRRVLVAMSAADARAIVSGLSPERRAEIGATSLAASKAGAVCR